MSASDDIDEPSEANADEVFGDHIAERTTAYCKLLALVSALQDAELRKEGVQMLSAVRRSFKSIPFEARVIDGGKE